MGNKLMEMFYGGLYIVFLISLMGGIFIGTPKLLNWYTLNMDRDYLENRAEKKVRDLRVKIRLIELENEALKLEKKLEEINGENDVTIKC